MKFTITITCDNAAFEDFPLLEVARILQKQVDSMKRFGSEEGWDTTLLDINGNTVGRAVLLDNTGEPA